MESSWDRREAQIENKERQVRKAKANYGPGSAEVKLLQSELHSLYAARNQANRATSKPKKTSPKKEKQFKSDFLSSTPSSAKTKQVPGSGFLTKAQPIQVKANPFGLTYPTLVELNPPQKQYQPRQRQAPSVVMPEKKQYTIRVLGKDHSFVSDREPTETEIINRRQSFVTKDPTLQAWYKARRSEQKAAARVGDQETVDGIRRRIEWRLKEGTELYDEGYELDRGKLKAASTKGVVPTGKRLAQRGNSTGPNLSSSKERELGTEANYLKIMGWAEPGQVEKHKKEFAAMSSEWEKKNPTKVKNIKTRYGNFPIVHQGKMDRETYAAYQYLFTKRAKRIGMSVKFASEPDMSEAARPKGITEHMVDIVKNGTAGKIDKYIGSTAVGGFMRKTAKELTDYAADSTASGSGAQKFIANIVGGAMDGATRPVENVTRDVATAFYDSEKSLLEKGMALGSLALTVAPGAGGVGAVARQGGKLVKAGSKASKFLDVANKTIHPVKGGISLVKKLELPTLNAVKKMGEVAHEGIEAGKNMRHGVVRSVKNTLRPTPSVSQKVLKAKGVIHPKQMDALIREKEELAKELALARKNFDEVIGEKKEYIYPAKERLLAARKKALINQKAIEKVGKQHLWPDVPKDHFTFDHLKVDKANAAEVAAESRRLKGRNLTRAEEEGVKTSSPIVDTSERLDKAFDKINDASDPKVLEQRTAYNNKAAKNLPKGKKAAEKTVDKALSAKDVPRQVSNHNATMANTALSKFTKSVSGPYLGEAVGVIEDVLSPVARFSPALRETTEAYISPRGTIKGIKKLFKKSTYKDAIEKGKTGFNELDREAQRLGIPTDVNVKYPKWLAKTSNWQGALRTPIQHAAFKKEMVKQIELAKRLGKELDYKEAFTAAYRASQRAIMRNDNQLMKRTVETLEDGKRVMKEIPKEKRVFRGLSDLADQRPAADLILPLPRGASNYVGRMAEYAVGVPHAVYKHIKSARRAGKMTAEEAGEIVRAYKRGLVGNATGVAGYYGASDIDDQGNVTIGGVKIPEKVMRTPVAELFRTGAQIKKTGLTRKTAEKVLGNVISNAPGSEILAPVSRALSRSQPGNPAADIGEAVGGGLVPPKVAAEAREIVEEMLSQQKPNPRKSKGAAIKAGAPVSPAVVAEAKRIIDEMVRIQKAKSKKHNRR